jgi:hypothetical protein
MQEVNLKHFIISIYFSFSPHVFVGISSFRVCGVVPWLGSGRNITLLHTHAHTHIILPKHFTYNFSLHTTPLHTWPTLKNFLFIWGIWWYWTAGRFITGCWAVWFQVWYPWLVLKTPLIPIYCWMALLLHSPYPKPVQVSGLGTGTWLCYANYSQTAYWGTIIQSGFLLLCSWNKWLRSEMLCYFSCVMSGLFTDQCVYCYWSNFGFITPVEFAYEASQFLYKLWEKHDFTVEPVITYIYLCGRSLASCLSFYFEYWG